jgi:hypothetical protein
LAYSRHRQVSGSVEKPELQAEFKSNAKITVEDKKKAKTVINTLFSLDLELNPFL